MSTTRQLAAETIEVKKFKKPKGIYIDQKDFNFFIEFMGSRALTETLYESGVYEPKDDIIEIPKKFNKFIDDVVIARIFLSHAKKKFGKFYLSGEAANKAMDDMQLHVIDKMLSHSFKKKKQTLVEFYKGFTVG